jgi:hypothetical protein
MSLAWLFNVLVYFAASLLSLTYGVKFGSTSTNEMITVWIIAMVQIYFFIEPIQVTLALTLTLTLALALTLTLALALTITIPLNPNPNPNPTVTLTLTQILIVVCAPFLCDDSTRCGRCCLRLRYCYNECFSP